MNTANQPTQPDTRTELLALRATIDKILERIETPVGKTPEPSQRFMTVQRYAERCGVSVVISTGWRSSFLHDELVTMLRSRGLTAEIVGQTPDVGPERMSEYPSTTRTREIKAWLSQSAGVTRWLAIDDMALRLEHAVQTDERTGIADADVERAILMLGRVAS